MHVTLFILVIVLALMGGFIGDLLEFAAWAVLLLALLGAIAAYLMYRAFDRVKGKIS